MKAIGLVHIHSSLSFDGHLSLVEIRDLAIANGFRFVLMAEHIEGLTTDDLHFLVAECNRLSDERCILIPGLEIEELCQYFLGMAKPIVLHDIHDARRELISGGAFTVLAHPHRLRYTISASDMKHIEAIEVWNVKDDGWRVPGYVGMRTWRKWNKSGPRAFSAIAGLDLHAAGDFRPIGIQIEVDEIDKGSILNSLHGSRYTIWKAGSLVDCGRTSLLGSGLGVIIAVMRASYKFARGRRQLLPAAVRKRLKRVIKG
jgi:hypothetical protein